MQMTFDNTSVKPDQELELSKDYTGTVEYPLPMTKFSSVYHLSIHLASNYGGKQTRVYYIGFAGEFLGERRDPGIVICQYEARALPQDHKADIPTGQNYQVSWFCSWL